MTANLWLKLLNGPLYIDEERFGILQVEPEPEAIDLLRNFKRLNAECKDHKFLARQIKGCKNPQRVPPYMWYLADKGAPFYRAELHFSMLRGIPRKLRGATGILIDCSQSMQRHVSPALKHVEIAAAWAVHLQSQIKGVFSCGAGLSEHKNVVGLGGIDRIMMAPPSKENHIAEAAEFIQKKFRFDRLIIFSNNPPPQIHRSCYFYVIYDPNQTLYKIDETEDNLRALGNLQIGTVH